MTGKETKIKIVTSQHGVVELKPFSLPKNLPPRLFEGICDYHGADVIGLPILKGIDGPVVGKVEQVIGDRIVFSCEDIELAKKLSEKIEPISFSCDTIKKQE